MAVSRRILLSGFPCIDPSLLGLSDGTANSVSIPIGSAPGRAYLTVTRASGDALDNNAAQTISFIDDGVTTVLSGYYINRRSVVNVDGDGQAACLVELFDKRALLSLSGINKRFNCLKPLPYHLSDSTQLLEKYFPDSLNGGTALYTWAQVWSALWAELPGIAGAAPSLPYTPAGTPKNFEFRGSTWDLAIPEFLAAICCTTKYDPITETFSVVRLSQAQTGLAAALVTANASTTQPLLFHSRDPSGLTVTDAPASWFILAPKQHVQNDDHTEPALDGTTASGVTGAASGTKEAIWLNTPATYCDVGGIQNNAEIVARAADLASELSGKATNSNGDGHIEYGGCVVALLTLGTGSQVSEIVVSDYGGAGDGAEGMRTKLYQYTLDLPHGPPQDINTDKIIRARLDAILVKGGSAAATVVVYVEGTGEWEPDACTLTIYDSLNFADFLPIGLEVWVKWNYDSEKWELLSVPPGNIIYFELTADKTLSTQPASAVILAFNGSAWVSSGIACYIYDDYYNAPGFFTGKANVDRGWAKLREKNASPPDDYELIWMSGPAHVVCFELTADRTAGAAAELLNATIDAYYLYGHDQLAVTQVYFRGNEFPRAFDGALGRAIYNDRERRYEAVQCDQIALFGTGILSGDCCGAASAAIEEAAPGSFWPFSTLHESLQGGSGDVLNPCAHCGKAGDFVQFIWVDYLEQYSLIDVERHQISVVIGQRISYVQGDGSDAAYSCVTEHQMQPICVELCEDPTWETVEHCCCSVGDPGAGGAGGTDCDQDYDYEAAAVSDQTGDCTCFTGLSLLGGGPAPWANTWAMTADCAGVTFWHLECESGSFKLYGEGVTGSPFSPTSHAGGTIVFDVADMSPFCSGAVKITFTGTPI